MDGHVVIHRRQNAGDLVELPGSELLTTTVVPAFGQFPDTGWNKDRGNHLQQQGNFPTPDRAYPSYQELSRVIQQAEDRIMQQLEKERIVRQDSVGSVRQLAETLKLVVEGHGQDYNSRLDDVYNTITSCSTDMKKLSLTSAKHSEDILTLRKANNERVEIQSMQVQSSGGVNQLESLEKQLRDEMESQKAAMYQIVAEDRQRIDALRRDVDQRRVAHKVQIPPISPRVSLTNPTDKHAPISPRVSLTSPIDKHAEMIEGVKRDVKVLESLLTDYAMRSKEKTDVICQDIEKLKGLQPAAPDVRTQPRLRIGDRQSPESRETKLEGKLQQLTARLDGEQNERKDAIERLQHSLKDFQNLQSNNAMPPVVADSISVEKQRIDAMNEVLGKLARQLERLSERNLDDRPSSETQGMLEAQLTQLTARLDGEQSETRDAIRRIQTCMTDLQNTQFQHAEEVNTFISQFQSLPDQMNEASRHLDHETGKLAELTARVDGEQVERRDSIQRIQSTINDFNSVHFNSVEEMKSFRLQFQALPDRMIEASRRLDDEVRERAEALSVMKQGIASIEVALKNSTKNDKDRLDALMRELDELRTVVREGASRSKSLESSLGDRVDSVCTLLQREERQRRDEFDALRSEMDRVPSVVRNSISLEKERIDRMDNLLQKLVPQLQVAEASLEGWMAESKKDAKALEDAETLRSKNRLDTIVNELDEWRAIAHQEVKSLERAVGDRFESFSALLKQAENQRRDGFDALRCDLDRVPSVVRDSISAEKDQIDRMSDLLKKLVPQLTTLAEQVAESKKETKALEVVVNAETSRYKSRLDTFGNELEVLKAMAQEEVKSLEGSVGERIESINLLLKQEEDQRRDGFDGLRRDLDQASSTFRDSIPTAQDQINRMSDLLMKLAPQLQAVEASLTEQIAISKHDKEELEVALTFEASQNKNRLAAIGHELDELRATAKDLTEQMAAANSNTKALAVTLETETAQYKSRLDAIANELNDSRAMAQQEVKSLARFVGDRFESLSALLKQEEDQRRDGVDALRRDLDQMPSCIRDSISAEKDQIDRMNDLLKNLAAQLQHDTQALEVAMNTVTSEYQSRLDEIAKELEELRATANDGTSRSKSLEASLGDHIDSVNALVKQEEHQRRDAFDALRRDLERMPSLVWDSVSPEKQRIDEINEFLTKLAPQVQAVESSVTKRIADSTRRIDAIDEHLGLVVPQLQDVEKSQAHRVSELLKVTEIVGLLKEDCNEQKRLQKDQIDNVIGQIEALKQQQSLLLEPALTSGPHLRQLGERCEQIQECLRKLELEHHATSPQLQQLAERCDEMQEEYTRKLDLEHQFREEASMLLEQTVGQSESLQKSFNKEKKRIDKLSPEMQALRADMQVYGSAYDALKADVQNLHGALACLSSENIQLNTSRLNLESDTHMLSANTTATFGATMLEDIRLKYSGMSVKSSPENSAGSTPAVVSPSVELRSLTSIVDSVAREREQIDARLRELEGV